MKVVHCECGHDVEAETDDELVAGVEAHVQEEHPDLVGKFGREDILAMAHDH
jgi:predicted small metal-binding protein